MTTSFEVGYFEVYLVGKVQAPKVLIEKYLFPSSGHNQSIKHLSPLGNLIFECDDENQIHPPCKRSRTSFSAQIQPEPTGAHVSNAPFNARQPPRYALRKVTAGVKMKRFGKTKQLAFDVAFVDHDGTTSEFARVNVPPSYESAWESMTILYSQSTSKHTSDAELKSPRVLPLGQALKRHFSITVHPIVEDFVVDSSKQSSENSSIIGFHVCIHGARFEYTDITSLMEKHYIFRNRQASKAFACLYTLSSLQHCSDFALIGLSSKLSSDRAPITLSDIYNCASVSSCNELDEVQTQSVTENTRQCSRVFQPCGLYLINLPEEVILNIMKKLDPSSLRRIRCTCSRLHFLGRDMTPGFSRPLFRHQLQSLRRMIYLESGLQDTIQPYHIRLLPKKHIISCDVQVCNTDKELMSKKKDPITSCRIQDEVDSSDSTFANSNSCLPVRNTPFQGNPGFVSPKLKSSTRNHTENDDALYFEPGKSNVQIANAGSVSRTQLSSHSTPVHRHNHVTNIAASNRKSSRRRSKRHTPRISPGSTSQTLLHRLQLASHHDLQSVVLQHECFKADSDSNAPTREYNSFSLSDGKHLDIGSEKDISECGSFLSTCADSRNVEPGNAHDSAITLGTLPAKQRIIYPNVYLHCTTGEVTLRPERIPIPRGGMLCDGPGLGKTVTMLALLHRMSLHCIVKQNEVIAKQSFDNQFHTKCIALQMERAESLAATDTQFLYSIAREFTRGLQDVANRLWPGTVDALDYGLFLGNNTFISLSASKSRFINKPSEVSSFTDLDSESVKISQTNFKGTQNNYHSYDGYLSILCQVQNMSMLKSISDLRERIFQFLQMVAQSNTTQILIASSSVSISTIAKAVLSHVDSVMEKILPPLPHDDLYLLTRSLMPMVYATLVLVPDNVLVRHWENQLNIFGDKSILGECLFLQHHVRNTYHDHFQHDQLLRLSTGGIVVAPIAAVNHALETEHPLHQVIFKTHWLRLVLDEGHIIGKGLNIRNAAIAAIQADIVWCMTGTPTPQVAHRTGISHLERILAFLRFQCVASVQAWRTGFADAFNQGRSIETSLRLVNMLNHFMIIHNKQSLANLPSPIQRDILLKPSALERESYNSLISFLKTNLVLTSMPGRTSALSDSILRQPRQARRFLKNLRLACCGGMFCTSFTKQG